MNMDIDDLYRKIKINRILLEKRKPYSPEVSSMINDLNISEWVYSLLKIQGSHLSMHQVRDLLSGNISMGLTLEDHSYVHQIKELINLAEKKVSWAYFPDEKLAFVFFEILSTNPNPNYRKTNPILLELTYNPPHYQDISEQMALLFHWLKNDRSEINPIKKACLLNNKFMEIYPFPYYNEAVALSLLFYLLLLEGFCPFELPLKDNVYNQMLSAYFNKEDIGDFYEMILKSLFYKLEVLMQLTV